jgi:hypothetical protein
VVMAVMAATVVKADMEGMAGMVGLLVMTIQEDLGEQVAAAAEKESRDRLEQARMEDSPLAAGLPSAAVSSASLARHSEQISPKAVSGETPATLETLETEESAETGEMAGRMRQVEYFFTMRVPEAAVAQAAPAGTLISVNLAEPMGATPKAAGLRY